MIFSSYRFIFFFLPIALIGFHLLRHFRLLRAMKAWLIILSLVFYGVGQPDFVAVFALSIGLNYLIILGLKNTQRLLLRRLLFAAAVIWNLGLLGWFKYTNFLLTNINQILGTEFSLLSIALPIGISFFTFQMLMYTVTCYRGECESAGFLDYAAFVSFFPQLIVGPVAKEDELMPELAGKALLSVQIEAIPKGILLFAMGCGKKILLADTMIAYAADFYSGSIASFSTVEAWVAVLCYTFAYYFDFSGYIDMARGLGFLFGVNLPINFDSPYKATDFADFWRRWNITISRFFNEYVFNNIFRFGDGVGKLILAVLATFAVSGFWHGAGWHYIIWGLVNGVLVCIANLHSLYGKQSMPTLLAVMITFFFATLVRVLFDCSGMDQAVQIYALMFSPAAWLHPVTLLNAVWSFLKAYKVLCGTILVAAFITFGLPNSNELSERETFGVKEAAFAAAILAVCLLNMKQVSSFLYFNF